jgi:Tol biopolymer transport system component
MRDERGIVQLWTVSPNGGEPRQITHHPFDVASAFSWSADSRRIAYVADQSIFVTEVAAGEATRLTTRTEELPSPRPEACVFSPDGRRIAYIRQIEHAGKSWNQIFVVACDRTT